MPSLAFKRVTAIWVITILIPFVIDILFGIAMRFNQGADITLSPIDFYMLMTTHGITMIGIWVAAGIVGVNYLLARYIKVSTALSSFALVLTIIAVLMIWAAILIGKFHAGWTFLYPLPFYVVWEKWATPVFSGGLLLLCVSWLIWTVGIVLQILKKYTLSQALALQHLSKKTPSVETPPIVLIATVSLSGVIACLIAGIILLVLLFAEYFSNGSFTNDPLLAKNLTYFFGHTLANESLYLGLAVLYELLPEVSGRPRFRTTWYVALGWNTALIFILSAFFHHLYMDFVQPVGLQIFGQIASYLASIPSVAVTIMSIAVLLYKNKIQWNLVNILFYIGVMGWVIGGIGALIDATISNNVILHNTLWVPAHFHTYNVMGNVLFGLAFFCWLASEFSGSNISQQYGIKMALLMIGGFGFVLMFYLAGAYSVPRRFSEYPQEFTSAAMLASAGAWFACIYLAVILWLLVDIIKKCTQIFFSPGSARQGETQ